MSRILFWIILFGAAYWFWRRAKAAALRAAAAAMAGAAQRAGGAYPGAAAGPAAQLEPMVQCAYCGAHSPRSATTALYRLNFCNEDHARLYASERATPSADQS